MQQLLNQLAPTMDAITKKLTHDKALQEDLGQEMRLVLWEQWQKTPDQTPAWYARVCFNRAVDYLRRGKSIDGKRRAGIERLSIEVEETGNTLKPGMLLDQNEFEATVIRRDLFRNLMHRWV